MAKRMQVQNRVAGDRTYRDERYSAMVDQLVAATQRGERDQCPQCQHITVSYTEEGTEEHQFVLAECSACGWQGA